MADDDDAIPCEGSYRNVPLHKGQSLARLRQVTADIDAAHALTSVNELYKFLRSPRNAPEARLYAAARALALFDLAREGRRARPNDVTRDQISAATIGLDSRRWQDRDFFATAFDLAHRPGSGAVPRRELLR